MFGSWVFGDSPCSWHKTDTSERRGFLISTSTY